MQQASRDTLYQALEKYDSIYIHESSQERYRPSSFHYDTIAQIYYRVDTLTKESAKTEFRYQLLHDTTYIHKVDTIPKVITITERRTRNEIPLFCVVLSLLGFLNLLCLLRKYHIVF